MSTNVSMGQEDITIINIYHHDNNFFLDMTPKAKARKAKKQVGMHKTEKLLQSKRNNQPIEWEKIF